MGGVQSVRNLLHLGGIPDTERATYFPERLMMGWYELLCCPSAMGCTIMKFQPKNSNGGTPKYKIKLRLSHSEHVPRYQLHVVQDGATKQWIVGHMEKTETHLRAKPGEFVRVQIWKLTSNSMRMESRRSALHRKSQLCMKAVRMRPTPSAQDMQMMGMSIATQGKVHEALPSGSNGSRKENNSRQTWLQTIGLDDRAYKVTIEPPKKGNDNSHHASMKSMSVMRILYRGKKVCIARKQRFAGALGKIEQPYLGVQIRPTDLNEMTSKKGASIDDDEEEEGMSTQFLDTRALMLLLVCLAWSEETMTPDVDMTDRFVQAMTTEPGHPGSASDLGLSVQWDTDDVKERLKHVDYARLHTWSEEDDVDHESEDEELDESPIGPSSSAEDGRSFV